MIRRPSDGATRLVSLMLYTIVLSAMVAPAAAAPALSHDVLMDLFREAGLYDVAQLDVGETHWDGEAVHQGTWVRFRADPRTGRIVSTSPID